MRKVRLIRHGESAANAGEASTDHARIPLTAKGVEQAYSMANSFAGASRSDRCFSLLSGSGNSYGYRSEVPGRPVRDLAHS